MKIAVAAEKYSSAKNICHFTTFVVVFPYSYSE